MASQNKGRATKLQTVKENIVRKPARLDCLDVWYSIAVIRFATYHPEHHILRTVGVHICDSSDYPFGDIKSRIVPKMSLSRAAFTEFILKYKELECLWNVSNIKYRNKQSRHNALGELLILLKKSDPNASIDSVTKKINIMRSSFNKELNKVKSSQRRGSGDIHVPKLWYYNLLLFLIKSTPKRADDDDSVDADTTDSFESDRAATAHHFQVEWLETDDGARSPSPEHQDTPETEAKCLNTTKRPLNPPPKRGLSKRLKQTSSDRELNEFDVFCDSLAIQLKKMPLQRALICQEKLQSVMTKERLFQVEQTQPSLPINPFTATGRRFSVKQDTQPA